MSKSGRDPRLRTSVLAVSPNLKVGIESRNKLQRRQPNCFERIIAILNGSRCTDREVSLTTLERGKQRSPKASLSLICTFGRRFA